MEDLEVLITTFIGITIFMTTIQYMYLISIVFDDKRSVIKYGKEPNYSKKFILLNLIPFYWIISVTIPFFIVQYNEFKEYFNKYNQKENKK